MAFDKTNTGIISKNDRKTEDKHPDIKGTINVDGKDYDLAGWSKKRNDGTGSFYSLKVSVPRAKPAEQAVNHDEDETTDSDIPF